MQAILELVLTTQTAVSRTDDPFGTKIGIFARLLGCRHKRFTRPITVSNSSYRACLDCGARRKFDTQNLKTSRAFYYPPSIKLEHD